MGSSAHSGAWDVVVVGGGHNALTAAAYLGRAGRRVLVLERAGHVGGAAVSEEPFPGVAARLSRYSYLVSLLPRRIVDDLGLDVLLARRTVSSYTPDPGDPERGLLVADDAEETRRSFARVGASGDHAGWTALYAGTARLAAAVFPTLTEPLPTRSELRERVGDAAWAALVERPLGSTLTEPLRSDLVRGVAATDGLIGTLTGLDDPSLQANRCFLYHVLGSWDVPVGGMGTVSDALARAARRAGARIVTGAEVTASTTHTSARSGPRTVNGCSPAWRRRRWSGSARAPARDPNPSARRSRSTSCYAGCPRCTIRRCRRRLPSPGGHIFHGDLAWPFLDDDAPRDTPARRWGVATAHPRVLLCGAGAVRGGGVSGIGGHNAAAAVLSES